VSITGKTIAVIGLGDIGCSTIKRLGGFEVKINAYDPFTTHTALEVGAHSILSFPDRIEEADFIILTCALTQSSKHIINKKSISLMKKGVCIINVARGGLINETDLLEAMNLGNIKSVALDVFEIEPIQVQNPLIKFEQCIFGSHNGSNTFEAVHRASQKSIAILFEFLGIK
jgi:D-3-phosphoglycerate dehydrogenase